MLNVANRGSEPRTVASVLDDLDAGHLRARPTTFPTGMHPLDHVLEGGLHSQDLTLVEGSPGVGKTIATLQWARHVASQGLPAVYACYEHDEGSLLARLLILEISEIEGADDPSALAEFRRLIRTVGSGDIDFATAVHENHFLRGAYERVDAYASKLELLRASGVHTGLAELERILTNRPEDDVILFVDYLQKVPVGQLSIDDAEKVTRIAEGLKEIALKQDAAIVAIVAGDREALTTRRLRLHHLRGSSALAYEADVAIMLNPKFEAVSKVHSAYDPVRAETFKRQVVFSIEKNREGPASLNLEFVTDFEHSTGSIRAAVTWPSG